MEQPSYSSIGFTGTRNGMTPRQKRVLEKLLGGYEPEEFHHGDCLGADAEAHAIASEVLGPEAVVVHPPNNDTVRAFTRVPGDRPPLPYVDRNHAIVDESVLLVAAPAQEQEVVRSGTWATVRYARKRKVPVWVIDP